MITLMTVSASSSSQATGWIAVLGASLVFGSTGIPFKTPSLQGVEPDPILFAFFAGFGIFIASLPLQAYLLWLDALQFQPWSLLGSLDILVTTFLAFQTVQQLGYAKGPAIWASVGMIFSFVIGAVVFQETITNMVTAILSVPCLIMGVILVISCQPSSKAKLKPDYAALPTILEDGENNNIINPNAGEIELQKVEDPQIDTEVNEWHESESNPDVKNNGTTTRKETDNTNTRQLLDGNILWGLLLGISTGLVDGSLMVPFKMTMSTTNFDIYQYLASFGTSSLIIAPIIFGFYWLYLRFASNKSVDTIPNQMKLSMIPGILNGILWGLANFMSVTATYHLSMRIAFPLTQVST